MTDTKKLKEYIENKIDLSNFTESEKNEIIDGVVKNISVAISIAVFENLNEEDRKEFLKLSELKINAKMLKFINLKIKDLKLLVTQTTDRIIDEFNELRKINP